MVPPAKARPLGLSGEEEALPHPLPLVLLVILVLALMKLEVTSLELTVLMHLRLQDSAEVHLRLHSKFGRIALEVAIFWRSALDVTILCRSVRYLRLHFLENCTLGYNSGVHYSEEMHLRLQYFAEVHLRLHFLENCT